MVEWYDRRLEILMTYMDTSTYIKKVIRQGAMLLPFVVIYKAAIMELFGI